jgi:hypothetical protein
LKKFMVDNVDPRLPHTSTAWQVWYNDIFDSDSAPSLQASGTNIIEGLRELWLHTLREGILENGHASFSRFHLTWGNSGAARVDIAVDPFHNPSLLKLRRWVGFMAQLPENDDEQRNIIFSRLAQVHYQLLLTSGRWQASAIDWSAEARELLARLEWMTDPKEL